LDAIPVGWQEERGAGDSDQKFASFLTRSSYRQTPVSTAEVVPASAGTTKI
jgi:hypothetical protein